MEFKSVDNGHKPTIFVDQFEEHLTWKPFPVDHILYVIFCYKSKVWLNGVSISQLAAETPTLKELERFLANKTNEVFVVHHELLLMLMEEGHLRTFRDRQVIDAGRTELRKIAKDSALLDKLGFRSQSVVVHKRLHGRRLEFVLRILAPKILLPKIDDIVKSNVSI